MLNNGKRYERPNFYVYSFALEDIITVSIPITTDEPPKTTEGVEIGTGGGEITVPFSDFFN